MKKDKEKLCKKELTKPRTYAWIIGLTVVITFLLILNGVFTNKNTSCYYDTVKLFEYRTHLEYLAIQDLSDRNVNILDRNAWLIKGDKVFAEHEYDQAIEELNNVQSFENKMSDITDKIESKHMTCKKFQNSISILNFIEIILAIVLLFLSANFIERTK